MRLILAISLGLVLVIVVAVLAILLGAFSGPEASVIPVISPTPLPSIASTPVPTKFLWPPDELAQMIEHTISPTPTPIATLLPIVTPNPTPVATSIPTPITAAGGGGGSAIPAEVPALEPTPTPTPRLPASPIRGLPSIVTSGQSFDVTIDFIASYSDFNAIVVQDAFPVGWVAEIDTAWCIPSPEYANIEDGIAQYLWYGPYTEGTEFTILYKVSAPEDAALGAYTFNGELSYYIAGSESISEDISGDPQITVVSP